jgi:predicted AAA+ superfamily ATPase
MYFIDPLLYQIAGGFLHGVRNTFTWWKKEIEDPVTQGKLFESIVINHMKLMHEQLYFWYSANTQKEVDILIPEGDTLRLYEIKKSIEYIPQVMGKDVTVITPETFYSLNRNYEGI